jgi:hypothetical protein
MRLTLPQQDIYFDQLLFPDRAIYNIGAKIKITGSVDRNVLGQAYHVLIETSETFWKFRAN